MTISSVQLLLLLRLHFFLFVLFLSNSPFSFSPSSLFLVLSSPTPILKHYLQRLVVVLRQNLYIHNIRDMKVSWSGDSQCTPLS